jgi:membrane complex biogenesis BtpA family protein
MDNLLGLFSTAAPIIGMLHLGALPGRPKHNASAGLDAIVDGVGRDLQALQGAGFDGVMFCNENDIPYQLHVGSEVPAAMAAVIGQLRRDVQIPFGVDVLWDPMAALAVARATGARWIREVLTGVYESDQGMIEPRIGDIAAYRHQIGADDVLLFDNIQPEFASAIGHRTIADRAKGAAFFGMNAILVSGWAAGTPMSLEDLRTAKAAAGDVPVFANTGLRAENIAEILQIADGAIVGTSLKVDGVTWNPVDDDRARRLIDAAHVGRKATGPAALASVR